MYNMVRDMRFRVGPSVLQLKKSVIVFGGAVLLIVPLLLYVFTSDPAVSTKEPAKHKGASHDKNDVGLLDQRLENLENELLKNRIMLSEVRETVQRLMFMQDGGLPPVGGKGISAQMARRNYVNVSSQNCINRKPTVQSDHVMLDVYEQLKFDDPDGGVWKQGWNLQYQENQWTPEKKLRVFVVPHSHNDPGWLKTFDKYFNDQTRHILNNMVTKMKDDMRWRFIWAEVSFLVPWWDKLDLEAKDQVKRYLADGQLEIVTGGWVMTDEASSSYYAIIDQMLEGHQWLEHNLDYRPQNGWAIDPFGLSPTMAYLLRRMGLNNMVIQRVHYSVKKYLSQQKSVEFLWRQSWDQNHTADILCHMMPFFSYDIPHTCGPDPKVCCQFDFRRLPGNKINCPWRVPPVKITEKNVHERANLLLDQYRKKSQLFRSNAVLVPLGDDFRFDKLTEWDGQFNNYQKLFDYMNNKEDWHVEAQFGTLEDYFEALREEVPIDSRNLPVDYPSLVGDFFTYADREDHYWSGYYTSRPFFKNMDRVLEAHLRGAEFLFSLVWSNLHSLSFKSASAVMMKTLVTARRSLGLFQHHDGITGTAKDIVMIDYASRLFESLQKLQKLIAQCSTYLLSEKPNLDDSIVFLELDEARGQYSSLPQKTVMNFTYTKKTWKVVVYNSLSHSRKEVVTLLSSVSNVEVRNSSNHLVVSQASPHFNGYRVMKDIYELSFLVDVPALSLSTYSVHMSSYSTAAKSSVTLYNHAEEMPQSPDFIYQTKESPQEFSINSFFLAATFSGADGMLRRLVTREDNVVTEVRIQFLIYGTRPKGKDRSGAYLFLPDAEAQAIKYSLPRIRVIEGPLFSEVVIFLPNVEHHIRLKNSPGLDGVGLEIFNIVDLTREYNKEIIMRLYTNVSNTNQEFFTDLNGFQIMRRKTFDKLPLQANVYPFTSMTFLQDNTSRLSVLSAQPLGVASLKPGWLEIFLDRRLNQDDNRGLQQGITDNKPTPSVFRLLLEKVEGNSLKFQKPSSGGQIMPSLLSHHVSLSLLHPLFLLLRIQEGDGGWLPSFHALGSEPPCDVHLMNLRTLMAPNAQDPSIVKPDNATVLFLHRMGFDCGFRTPVLTCSLNVGEISVHSLFPRHFGSVVEEMSLSLMYLGTTFSRENILQIPPMEIITLKLIRR